MRSRHLLHHPSGVLAQRRCAHMQLGSAEVQRALTKLKATLKDSFCEGTLITPNKAGSLLRQAAIKLIKKAGVITALPWCCPAGPGCLEEGGSVIVRDDLDALLQVRLLVCGGAGPAPALGVCSWEATH